jgi:integrase
MNEGVSEIDDVEGIEDGDDVRAARNLMSFTDLGLSRLNVKRRLKEINERRRAHINDKRRKKGLPEIAIRDLNQAQIWDEGCRGLSLLISPGGTKTFRATFKLNGKWISHSLGRFGEMVPDADAKKQDVQISEARRQTTDYRAKAQKGIDPRKAWTGQDQSSGLTYGEVVDKFIEHYAKPRQRTWDQTERILKVSCKDWLTTPITKIDKHGARDLLRSFAKAGHPYKATSTLRWLRCLWKWARDEDYVTDPIMDAVKIDVDKPVRTRTFSDDEIKAIWSAADRIGRIEGAYIKLLMLLAPRKTALAKMRYSDLSKHDKDGNPTLWTTPHDLTKSKKTARKSGKEPRIYLTPLPPFAQRVLKGVTAKGVHSDDLVFPGLSVNETKAGRPSLRITPLTRELIRHGAPKDFTPHTMRHTLATWLQEEGHSEWERGLVLNHSGSGSVTEGYSHAIPLKLKLELLTKWADHVEGLMQPEGVRTLR